jgi:hypothetical protein
METDINLFADDTSLMNIINEMNASYDMVNRDLQRLSEWADQWLVTFNATKTEALHVTNRREVMVHPTLSLNQTDIAEVASHCHLGVDLEGSFSWQTHLQRVSSKATKCVGLMRRVSRDLPRECLEKLYLTMVRPILEYGGLLYDKSPKIYTTLLDKVQREAAIVCTGAYKHTKTTNLLDELGWDTLETRRGMQRACTMYKIQNEIAPTYLVETCPSLVGERNNYNLRNAEDIEIPLGRKTGYFNSFFPNTIRLWNNLDRSIKNRDSLESFKYHLKKAKCRKRNKLYSKFNGSKAVNHTRMRLGLSGLKAQRYEYNHVPNPTCEYCGARREDALHFLLQCRTFAHMRVTLLDSVNTLYRNKNIVRDLTRTIVQKELVSCLLKGDVRLNEQENIALFEMVQQFIQTSNRF